MIVLPPALIVEATARSVREAPNEACGLISQGQGGLRLHAARNAAQDPTSTFLVDPEDQIQIAMALIKCRRHLVGIYHSHPERGPEPSLEDTQMAKVWPGLTWLIIGLHGDEQAAIATHWAGILAPL